MNTSVEMIDIPETDEELLAQCEVQTYRSGGKGGQHVNKTETGVRLIHLPTGTVATCTAERSQFRNKTICLQRLRRKLEKKNIVVPERVPTSKPAHLRGQEVEDKRRRGATKAMRKSPGAIEEE